MVEAHKFVLIMTCPNELEAEATKVEVLVCNPLHP
jgi:hypothetical protein